MNGTTLASVRPAAPTLVLLVLMLGSATAGVVQVPQDQASIQGGVDAAAPGDTVLVAAGVYTEQVVINSDVTLLGAGSDATRLQAPESLPHAVGNFAYHPVVSVEEPATAVTVRGLTIDGLGRHPDTGRFAGLVFYRVTGLIEDVTVENVHPTPPDDAITGVGILVSAGWQTALPPVTLRDVTVERFQKAGVAIGGSLEGAHLERVRVRPLDIYSDVVQNGIELSLLPQATLIDCEVSGVYYDGDPFPEYTATGILGYYCGEFTLEDCRVVENQAGIYLISTEADIRDSRITAIEDQSIYCHGLVSIGALTPGARADGPRLPGVRPLLAEGAPPTRPQFTDQLRLRDTVLDGKGRSSSRGIGLLGETANALVFVAERCDIRGWETGVTSLQAGISTVYGRLAGCRLTDNQTYAIYAATGSPMDARGSWFGHPSGPYHPATNPLGLGDTVSDQVLYDPWLTGNVALVPTPQAISLADHDGTAHTDTVSLAYLGGADDLVYGFSAEVQWDPALVDVVSIERPASGPFADAVAFQVLPTASGAVIDAALGGARDGIARGELCRVRFAAVDSLDWTRAPVQLTLHHARDRFNQEVTGLGTDPGAVDIDLQRPVVHAVTIRNETLDHTDQYAKDGDLLAVTATITDADPTFGRHAVRGIGPNLYGAYMMYSTPDSYVGDQAVWAARPAALTPTDGPAPFLAEARDPSGNFSVLRADTIMADNTPPTPVSGLVATAGHNLVTLTWDAPAASDANYRQTAVRREPWQGYPFYDDPAPAYPASPDSGQAAYLGTDSTTTLAFAADGSERDILALAAFHVDLAGNVSPAAASAQALTTTYRLGDVRGAPVGSPGDGVVDLYDITRLGDAFGRLRADPDFDGECDLGPADDGASGIPAPDGEVGLDDLAIFADRYDLDQGTTAAAAQAAARAAARAGTAAAGQSPRPTATPHLVWRHAAPGVWSLVLAAPCPALKAVALRAVPTGAADADAGAEAGAGAGWRVEPGSLLAGQPAPHALVTSGDGARAALAVLGRRLGLVGHGELLRAVSHRPRGRPPFALAARDTALAPLLVAGGDVTAADPSAADATPRAFAMHGPHPNPFNPATTLRFALPRAEAVTLAIYGLDGRRVRTLIQGTRPAGQHAVRWDGRDRSGRPVAAGTYLYELRAGPWQATGKLGLVK